MIHATFATIADAVDHARDNGGWIWQRAGETQAEWFDAAHYTRGEILRELVSRSGFVGTWGEFKRGESDA